MNRRIRVVGGLIGCAVLVTAFGCSSDEVLGTIDGGSEDGGGDDAVEAEGSDIPAETPADEATDTPGDEGDPDSLGTCFEIFGPAGISHRPPRRHDAGLVAVGSPHAMPIRFYNFCSDPAARLLALDWLDGPGEFAVTSAPAIGDLFSLGGMGTFVTITFTPTTPGIQYAQLRVSVSNGYYDFEFAAEGVAAGGAPALLDLVCLEADRHVEFGRVALTATPANFSLELPLLCEHAFGTGHLVVESAVVTGGTEAFSLNPIDSSYAGVVANNGVFGLGPPVLPAVQLRFAPSVSGTYNGELTLQTNDVNGTYVVSFAATAD